MGVPDGSHPGAVAHRSIAVGPRVGIIIGVTLAAACSLVLFALGLVCLRRSFAWRSEDLEWSGYALIIAWVVIWAVHGYLIAATATMLITVGCGMYAAYRYHRSATNLP